MLAIAIPAGLLIGLSLGALGGGGSILTVPVLVYLLHQPPHAATAGSLLIVGITATAGMIAHRRAGRVRLAAGVLGVLGVAGAYAGTRLSSNIQPDLLLSLFAGLMLVAAAAMARRRRGAVGRHVPAAAGPHAPPEAAVPDDLGVPSSRGGAFTATLDKPAAAMRTPVPSMAGQPPGGTAAVRQGLKMVAAATGVGLLTGFFGVGGGFVIVPALVLVLGFEMPVAVGTSLLVIAVNSAAAFAARLGGHVHLDWPLLGVFIVAALAGTLAGNRVASRVDASRLTAAFAILLVAVAAYSLIRSLPALV
ncbi:MAG TPA: sulfite exporter TauE/SafE family protein [Streptosporangiaceae bacterium]|nr:sulfite exporter TauE/SafE family protein [Streptosporangiaceae bacterium]